MSVGSYWSSVSYNGSGVSYSYRCVSYSYRMSGVSGVLNDSVESVVGISGVVDSSGGAVGLKKAVVTLNNITLSLFRLFLHVSSVSIMNSVVEVVVGWSLKEIRNICISICYGNSVILFYLFYTG